jgi:hypothetical protein
MQANKVPILIQWRGESPDEAKSAEEGRRLRKSVGPSAAQKFYQRMRALPEQANIADDKHMMKTDRKLQGDFNHVVTFQDCIFTVCCIDSIPCTIFDVLPVSHLMTVSSTTPSLAKWDSQV